MRNVILLAAALAASAMGWGERSEVPSVVEPSATGDTPVNYVGYYARWGWESGCVGGTGPGQHPDLLDIWLVNEYGGEVYVGETTHTNAVPGCAYHQATFQDNLNTNYPNACDGGPCGWHPDYGQFLPHKHSKHCTH